MQELVFVKAGQVEWREAPTPTLTSGSDVLIRPIAVATCDLDAAIVRGRAPFAGPFPMGHEFVGEIADIGSDVAGLEIGQRFSVPFQICCGTCRNCRRGITDSCETAPPLAMYGLGPLGGDWGGALSDLVRVPYPEFMLVPLPDGVSPASVASLSDNIPDAWRTVGPHLANDPGAEVLIVGGMGARSISMYACQLAVILGASRVDYVDHDPEHLAMAERMGANPIEATSPSQAGPYESHFPRRLGPYAITVDSSGHPDGLALAIRSTAPGGHCTAVGIFYEEFTRMPLLEMYTNGATFHTSRVAARAVMPQVLELITAGRFDPGAVTTATASWADAVEAVAEASIKLVVTRDT